LAGSAKGDCGEDLGHAETVRPQVDVWPTDAARAHERYSYWREALCQSVFKISIEAVPERFSARVAARGCGPLRFFRSEASGYRVVRSQRGIESAPTDHYSVYLQVSGQAVIEQGDETFTYHPNDISIVDGRYPFRADVSGAGACAIAVIPRAMIDRRAPWLSWRPLHRLAATSRFVDLAGRHIMELTAEGSRLSDRTATLLTDNLCNLLALASVPDIAPGRLQPELQIEAIFAFCRQHLHHPDLSPQFVADHFGIALRTLHLRFQKTGQSFGRWVLDHRLDACRAALRDDNQRTLNISEIAYRWGFNDLSHFNKAFRARFNETPREARMTHTI
jgi:AraC-like DNA-binding protein